MWSLKSFSSYESQLIINKSRMKRKRKKKKRMTRNRGVTSFKGVGGGKTQEASRFLYLLENMWTYLFILPKNAYFWMK